jgi:hypothetical protein
VRLKLELDQETSEALNEAAERELRLPSQQAETLLRQALGLPFPIPPRAFHVDDETASREVAHVG